MKNIAYVRPGSVTQRSSSTRFSEELLYTHGEPDRSKKLCPAGAGERTRARAWLGVQ
jgi:hypothetical protein